MNTELIDFATRLRGLLSRGPDDLDDQRFSELALELFSLQFKFNPAYEKICAARGLTPTSVVRWQQIPAAPTSAFKELELSCIPAPERTTVFHSSGTTEQKPSRHCHHAASLAVYETALWEWFARHFDPVGEWLFLTPPRSAAPHSSLIHMCETIRRKLELPASTFMGDVAEDGSWILDFPAIIRHLQSVIASQQPLTVLGTAFSFVHLLDDLAERGMRFQLPVGSRVMETGGYKNRSRSLPKAQLHELITDRLGVPRPQITCEYGMSELSSQAYTAPAANPEIFNFPAWARVQIISPETGREVAEGQTGIIRVFDLANVYSVAAIQTEDLGVRRGDAFELIGRVAKAESRGCSLMSLAR